jgi:general secretion pathway protein A
MYCKFFGFSEKPFDPTPQPRFLYLSSAHREALASLLYGIRERRGFITLVGDVGTGKTIVLRATLDQLDEKTRVALIINPELRFIDLLALVLNELGLRRPKEKILKVQALHRLNQFAIRQLAQNSNVVLMVDEAQHLSSNALENLRLLSNLESRERKLIQIVLAGQPELDVKLSRHDMRQFVQRISLRRYIMPLSRKETYEYILHRLQVAGYSRRRFFSDRALELIWKFSRGVPRRINILCDNVLLIAYSRNQKKIKAAVMKEAVKDLSYSPFVNTGKRRWFWFNRKKTVAA